MVKQVLSFARGADGKRVALYVGNRAEAKAVVTDMPMPYMDGAATIRALDTHPLSISRP